MNAFPRNIHEERSPRSPRSKTRIYKIGADEKWFNGTDVRTPRKAHFFKKKSTNTTGYYFVFRILSIATKTTKHP